MGRGQNNVRFWGLAAFRMGPMLPQDRHEETRNNVIIVGSHVGQEWRDHPVSGYALSDSTWRARFIAEMDYLPQQGAGGGGSPI